MPTRSVSRMKATAIKPTRAPISSVRIRKTCPSRSLRRAFQCRAGDLHQVVRVCSKASIILPADLLPGQGGEILISRFARGGALLPNAWCVPSANHPKKRAPGIFAWHARSPAAWLRLFPPFGIRRHAEFRRDSFPLCFLVPDPRAAVGGRPHLRVLSVRGYLLASAHPRAYLRYPPPAATVAYADDSREASSGFLRLWPPLVARRHLSASLRGQREFPAGRRHIRGSSDSRAGRLSRSRWTF